MSQDFTKDLSPYEDSNHNPIRGQYHFDIPQDIEPNAYSMNIDYESHDDAHPDAYQYDGWIVIGHRPYFFAPPLIVPYNTLAVSEEAITAYEKFSTTFNAIVKTYSDSALTKIVKNLPYHLRVLKGQFKDYYEDESTARTRIVDDFNTSSQLMNISMPQSSGSTGTGTTPLKISDIYESSQTIQNYNTLFARCKGTRDRGTDNYVPGTVVIPLILGTTGVYLRSISSRTTLMDIDNNGTEDTVTTVCGGGTVKLDIDIFYQWAMRQDTQNNHMKYGYEDWRTDVNKQVMVGSVKLQTNINGTWEDVPKSLLTPVNQYTTILDNGSIIHTPNTKGELEVYFRNPVRYDEIKTFKYRFAYTGKVGATFDNYSGELYCETNYTKYGTDVKIPTKLFYQEGDASTGYNIYDATSTIELFKGIDNNLVFKTYAKQGNDYIPLNYGLNGELRYTFYGEDGTVITSGIGVGVIHLPKEKRGLRIEVTYVPNSSNLQGCSATFNIHYTPQSTKITFSPPKTTKVEIIDAQMDGQIYLEPPISVKVVGEKNVPVTGGTLTYDFARLIKQGDNVITVAEIDDIENSSYLINGERTTFEIPTLPMNKLMSIMQSMHNKGECIFDEYTLTAKYRGNSDFLSQTQIGHFYQINYKAKDPEWMVECYRGNTIIEYPEEEGTVYKIVPNGTVKLVFSAWCETGINLLTGDVGNNSMGIPNLKTNVSFYDYDNDIVLADGTTVKAGKPLEIPTESNTWFTGSLATNEGKTDSEGECTWTWELPHTQTWQIERPNCKLRVTIQEKTNVHFENTVIEIPFKITNN